MHGLEVTFRTLAETKNVSAIDVLIEAINEGDRYLRRGALAALLQRTEKRCVEALLGIWDRLDPDNIATLKSSKTWLNDVVIESLTQQSNLMMAAIRASKDAELYLAIPRIIELAETHRARSVRIAATDTVLTVSKKLGFDARHDQDSPARRPILARLDDSVRRISMHRNEDLIDAFLMVSTFGDVTLKAALSPDEPSCKPLLIRLEESQQFAVIELLAGFLHRRKFSSQVAAIIRRRPDALCREAILQSISNHPSPTVLRNLSEIGIPMSCRGDEKLIRQLPPERRAALVQIHIATSNDIAKMLHVICSSLEIGGPGTIEAAVLGLSRCEVPDFDFWLPAILILASDNVEQIESNEFASLLLRMIDLLSHKEEAIAKGAQRVLGALSVKVALARFEEFDADKARQIGQVVLRVDSDAIAQVRDGLRHPVLKHRLAAITAADSLAAVDSLVDIFDHILHDDHQDARILAAQAMAKAKSERTLELLQEMTELPDCAARDAAVEAYQYRQSQLVKE